MSIFREIGRGLKGLRRGGENVLRGSFTTAASFFTGGGRNTAGGVFYRFFKYLFSDGGELFPETEKIFCRIMASSFPDSNAAQLWRKVESAPLSDRSGIVAELRELAPEKLTGVVNVAASMIRQGAGTPETGKELERCALEAGMAQEQYNALLQEIEQVQTRRERMLRSGAGIMAALIVIAVFILTATLLRSVIFGLIAAYLLLPLEQYFERSWREKRGAGFLLGKFSSCLWWLPRKTASVLRRRDSEYEPSPEQLRRKEEQKIIARAVGQTVLTALLAVVLFASGIYILSANYLRGVREKFRTVSATALRADGTAEKTQARLPAGELQRLKKKLSSLPGMKYLLEKAESTLRDEQTRHELTTFLWRRSGGVFSFLFNVMGFVGTLLCDLLLTLFFGLLFLMKMAEFKNSGRGSGGNYAVQSILLSNWLPNVSETTLSEAQRILSGVFSRLRIWVRGYLTLVIIDSTVYTVLFGILDVPCFPLLGIIAGCGILLPYVGPIFSCCLTLLVTYLAGDPGVSQLVLILCCYLVYNGIIEQFILYPMVIGESLGLTTLETIIVVLLGAIFAGIAGMILALPAASVIKYLVPQIYRCWDVFLKRGRNEQGTAAP